VELAIALLERSWNMKCERCISNEEGTYRVSSDVMEVNVCPACAVEARRLGLTVERLETDYRRPVLSAADAAA
jgi:ribosome-binding protein aMBF1 (putative translation factor)